MSAWQLEPPPKLREEVLDLPIVGTSRYFVSSAARRYYLSAGEDVGLEQLLMHRQTPSAGCKRSEVVSVTEVQPESKSKMVMTKNHRIWLPHANPLECYKVRRSRGSIVAPRLRIV